MASLGRILWSQPVLQSCRRAGTATVRTSQDFYRIFSRERSRGFLEFEKLNYRNFQTSRPRYIHPLVAVLLRPIFKFTAVLVGRGARKWWKALPEGKKTLFRQHLKRNQTRYLILTGTGAGLSYLYYESHVTATPITSRRRYMAFSEQQVVRIGRHNYERIIQECKTKLLPETHPYMAQVVRVGNRLLNANRDLPEVYTKRWTMQVVDSPEINAFVLPTGDVIVFAGILSSLENDDQVAAMLGHEMSHALLGHAGELLSHAHLLDFLVLIPLATIWAFLPNDGIAAVAHWFLNKAVTVIMDLPYSRKLEEEADKVGLMLCAKACFDVRESSTMWGYMSILEDMKAKHRGEGPMKELSWLSTHPSHEQRESFLNQHMNDAISIRKQCQCPELTSRDPRERVDFLRKHWKTVIGSPETVKIPKDTSLSPVYIKAPAGYDGTQPLVASESTLKAGEMVTQIQVEQIESACMEEQNLTPNQPSASDQHKASENASENKCENIKMEPEEKDKSGLDST